MTTVIVNLIATLLMTGIIWFVQVVHYPLFSRVGTADFVRYEQDHTRRTGYVVAPLLLVESGSALALLFMDLPPLLETLAWGGAVLVLLLWIVTFTVQVPLHRRLSKSHDRGVIQRLVRTNTIRVALWSMRAVLMITLLAAHPEFPVV